MKKNRKSIFDSWMEEEKYQKAYEKEKKLFEIEYQIGLIMERLEINQTDLAKRLNVDKSVVSKDLSGSVKRATLKKLNIIAEALNCEFLPLFIPKDNEGKIKEKISKLLLKNA